MILTNFANMTDRKLLSSEMGRVSPEQYRSLEPSGIVVVLDNVRSAHNVGSVLRSCDAFKIDKVFLCGICATPPSAEIHKAALGAEDSVPWEHVDDTMDAVRRLRAEGYRIVSIEQTEHSVSLADYRRSEDRLAVILGNEVDGVRQDVVDESDFTLEVPQWGTKHSLNVSVCAGVILWHCRLTGGREL